MERSNEHRWWSELYDDLYNMSQEQAALEALVYREAKLRKNSAVQKSAGRAVMYYLLRRTGLDTLADVPIVGENGYYKDTEGDNVKVVDYLASGLGGHAEGFLLKSVDFEPGKDMDTLRGMLSAAILQHTPKDHPQVEAFLMSPASIAWSDSATRPMAEAA